MSEFKDLKFWIGDDPELSEKVQKLLFGMGYKWLSSSTKAKYKDTSSIYAGLGGDVTHSNCSKDGFIEKDYEEINIEWLRTNKPETITLGGKTYIKSELEEALRHIKPV